MQHNLKEGSLMSHNALMKLAKINAHIQELETERKMIREKLNQTLL